METVINDSFQINDGVTSSFRDITLRQLQKAQSLLDRVCTKKWGSLKHSSIMYILFWSTISVYGGKACPFTDEQFLLHHLNNLLLQVFIVLGIIIGVVYVLRLVTCSIIGKERLFRLSTVQYLAFESMFFVLAIALFWVLGIRSNFIIESILKITIGPLVLGFFAVLNMVLYRQRFRLLYNKNDEVLKKDLNIFLSIRSKLIVISIIVFVLVGIAFALVSYKNFLWLVNTMEYVTGADGQEVIIVNGASMGSAVASVFKEVLFIISVFVGWMVITSFVYATNMKIIFMLFNNTIYNVFKGNYQQIQIPVLNDEFGVMGENINIVVGEIKEKENIKSTFGKFVSPRIRDQIIKGGISLEDGGAARDIVVLSSDIRNFTSTTHSSTPKDVVNSLNYYFTDMVKIVEKYDGMVDKFIGDALMGLFGYDDIKKGINNAVYAALYMQDHQLRIKSDIKIGVGIASGEAVVGLVGSPDRLDFTAIGDVVNTAFRLESATKELEVDVLIHHDVYNELYQDIKQLTWKKFEIRVKGIPVPLTVYGLKFDRGKYL